MKNKLKKKNHIKEKNTVFGFSIIDIILFHVLFILIFLVTNFVYGTGLPVRG